MKEPSILRAAVPGDLDWIVGQELRPEFAAFIHCWPEERHRHNLEDGDYRYLTAENEAGERTGYVILRGIETPERSVELVRIVAAEPGQGLGRLLLAETMRLVFEEFGANRLWLDVFDDNDRARRTYRAVGFVEEGLLRDSCLRGDGRLGSLVVMSVLRSEFEALSSTN